MNELLILLALVGTTLIVVRGIIFRPIRRLWPALLGCSQCVGFWVGAGVGLSGLMTTGYGRIMDTMIVGTAGSMLSLSTDAILLKLLGDPEETKT
jgi:zinc transporter ZupT